MSDPTKTNDGTSTHFVGAGVPTTLRWSVYLLLIIVATGIMLARVARVRSADPKNSTPFLSANDRSRWATIRALSDDGTYAIEHVVFDQRGNPIRGWHTIDMVRHRGPDGREHYYSSKPTLLTTLLAGEYWLIKAISGATLSKHTLYVARVMLILTNVLPLALALFLMARLIDQHAITDFARIFAVAAACFGTFLTTFAITLNNHVPAAISLIGALALSAFLIGLAGLSYLSITWILANATAWNELFPDWAFKPLHQRPAVLYSIGMLLLGAQFISMGFLAELFTAYYGRTSVPYSVKARVGQCFTSDDEKA